MTPSLSAYHIATAGVVLESAAPTESIEFVSPSFCSIENQRVTD